MKQLIIEIPESYSRDHKLRIIERLEKKYKDVCILETECTEIKIHNLNDSFTREMHNALKLKQDLLSVVFNHPKRPCRKIGANTKVADTYGWELGSDENAILDVILSQYEIRDSGIS